MHEHYLVARSLLGTPRPGQLITLTHTLTHSHTHMHTHTHTCTHTHTHTHTHTYTHTLTCTHIHTCTHTLTHTHTLAHTHVHTDSVECLSLMAITHPLTRDLRQRPLQHFLQRSCHFADTVPLGLGTAGEGGHTLLSRFELLCVMVWVVHVRACMCIFVLTMYVWGWPEPYIYSVYTAFLAGKSPNVWSYTVYTHSTFPSVFCHS